MNNSIWCISVIYITSKGFDCLPRTFGFYIEYADAISAIHENRCDMHECLYNYLVLEKVSEGIHGAITEQIWFAWSRTNNRWERCEPPKEAVGFCNFAMG